MSRVLIHGWYGHYNLGDEAFRPALQHVLGDVELTFTDRIGADVNDYDALVVGGGSFLDVPLATAVEPWEVKIPTGFIGVGLHEFVHPENLEWLERAAVVVSRNRVDFDDVLVAPDLIFARELFQTPERFVPNDRPRLLVLPNGFLVPGAAAPAWKVRAADAFEIHMTRLLVEFDRAGWDVTLQPMLAYPGPVRTPHDDRVAAMRLMTMTDPERIEAGAMALSEDLLLEYIEQADLVVSARFHGCVMATMAGVPFVGISAHNKFQSFFDDNRFGNWIDFHHFDPVSFAAARLRAPALDEMEAATRQGRKRWDGLSDIVRAKLSL